MHIAFNGWFWDQENTGSGQYLRRLLHHLHQVEPGLQMTLVLPPHNTTPDGLPENVNLITTGNGKKKNSLRKVWFEQRIFPQMAKRAGADLAHVPYWGPPLSSPLPLVTSVLDVIPLMFPVYSQGLFQRLYLSLVVTAARGSAHIITLSESAKIDIEAYLNIPEEKISAIYLAADAAYHPKIGAERDEEVRRKYNLPDHFVLYLGGFDPRKQVNALLLAYTYVAEAEGDRYPLVIGGKEPRWGTPMFPDLRQYAQKLNIQEYVQWIGFVDEADKPSLYRLADVFVFPSEYEGFGLMSIEAMACGTPVVAMNIDVMNELLGDGAVLVDDERQMAGSIISLLLDSSLRQTMMNQGLAQSTRFSWRKTAQQTIKVYEYVLRQHKQPR